MKQRTSLVAIALSVRIPLDMTGSSDDMTKRNRLGHRRKFDAMPTCPTTLPVPEADMVGARGR